MADIPVILLAAGGSGRMGSPKPLLPWGDRTLVEDRLEVLLKTGQPVFVVLGYETDSILPLLEGYSVEPVVNDDWVGGMGSSIRCGINATVKSHPQAGGVLITLLDQPMVSDHHLNRMIGVFNQGAYQIIASRAASGWLGAPVLFDRNYFDRLRQLEGDEGARSIVKAFPDKVRSVPSEDMLEDMDTPEAYERLMNKFNQHY